MKKLILTILITILLQPHVYSQLSNYNANGRAKILTEKTTLSIIGVNTNVEVPNENIVGILAAAAAILPPVIDLVVTSIKKKTEKDVLAYKGEYKCWASDENFYKTNNVVSLPKMTIKRIIKTIKAIDTLAVEIELIPDISTDKTAFRYYVKDKCVYNYSVAKTKSHYDYIDLNLEIKFKSISIDRDAYNINDLRTTAISIPMIHVGNTKQLTDTIYSGWIPLPPMSTKKKIAEAKKEEITTIKTNNAGIKDTTNLETTTKKSNDVDYEKLKINTGLYEVEITATETNPYKIKAENNKKIIENSSESTTAILKAVVNSFIKEK